MNFTRYQKHFFILSILSILSFFLITYYYYDGFARSLSFNGGIRISFLLPSEMGKDDLEKASAKAGLVGAVIRTSNPRTNTWDVELGPKLRDRIAQEIQQEEGQAGKKEKSNKAKATKDNTKNNTQPKIQGVDIAVSYEIERRLLEFMKLPRESIIASDTITASYGDNLTSVAIRILIYTIIGIALYLSFRFDFPFAVGASIALIHDLLFTLGVIGILRIEPSIPVLAAVLTVLGYSINDTIVIFDRIRDNTEDRSQATSSSTINLSLTQTLSRTIVTSVLTLLAVLALLLGGERSLKDFAIVVLIGVFVGTYSSIFIATPSVKYYEQFRNWIRR